MGNRLLYLVSICILSLAIVACSNKNDTSISEENGASEITKEQILFEEKIIIADDDIVEINVLGKEKLSPGNTIGYTFSIFNNLDETIKFYVKDVIVDGNKRKTNLDENLKLILETTTQFTTQLTPENIESLEDLKNTEGIFCIETNDGVKEYKFKLE